MSGLLIKLFGENYKTTTAGSVFAVCLTFLVAVSAKPELLSFLPLGVQGASKGVIGLISAFAGVFFAFHAKDKEVTGGTIPQTTEAEKRVEEPNLNPNTNPDAKMVVNPEPPVVK